jgi:hypothetical protein
MKKDKQIVCDKCPEYSFIWGCLAQMYGLPYPCIKKEEKTIVEREGE